MALFRGLEKEGAGVSFQTPGEQLCPLSLACGGTWPRSCLQLPWAPDLDVWGVPLQLPGKTLSSDSKHLPVLSFPLYLPMRPSEVRVAANPYLTDMAVGVQTG